MVIDRYSKIIIEVAVAGAAHTTFADPTIVDDRGSLDLREGGA
jgi:hypothetical protein